MQFIKKYKRIIINTLTITDGVHNFNFTVEIFLLNSCKIFERLLYTFLQRESNIRLYSVIYNTNKKIKKYL